MIGSTTVTDEQAPSESLVALEAETARLTSQRAAYHARVAAIDAALPELRDLVGEVETRIRAQNAEVGRLLIAGGPEMVGGGRDYTERTVIMRYGGETVQLSGPRPLGTPRGDADHARRVLDALEDEAKPVRGALTSLERERGEVARAAGLLGGAIEGVEQQIARMRAQEGERRELIGATSWRDRLSVILRRFGQGTTPGTVQELRAAGKSVRDIAEATGISKSQVQRELAALGVPDGTADQAQGA